MMAWVIKLSDGDTVMAIVLAQTTKLSRFFGRIAQRLYESRLATVEREVKRHREFLGVPKL
jgi:hypothetical protein